MFRGHCCALANKKKGLSLGMCSDYNPGLFLGLGYEMTMVEEAAGSTPPR